MSKCNSKVRKQNFSLPGGGPPLILPSICRMQFKTHPCIGSGKLARIMPTDTLFSSSHPTRLWVEGSELMVNMMLYYPSTHLFLDWVREDLHFRFWMLAVTWIPWSLCHYLEVSPCNVGNTTVWQVYAVYYNFMHETQFVYLEPWFLVQLWKHTGWCIKVMLCHVSSKMVLDFRAYWFLEFRIKGKQPVLKDGCCVFFFLFCNLTETHWNF